MDDAQFSRLIRESGLTPELDMDTLIRCTRQIGQAGCQRIFAALGFVPNREDVISMLKEIGKHVKIDVNEL